MSNNPRKIEISNKFIEMGKALLDEGIELEDYTITQSGTIMIILATVLTSDEDMFMFSEVCGMFSAKKILMDMEGIDEHHIVSELLRKKEKTIKKRTPKKKGPDEEK